MFFSRGESRKSAPVSENYGKWVNAGYLPLISSPQKNCTEINDEDFFV